MFFCWTFVQSRWFLCWPGWAEQLGSINPQFSWLNLRWKRWGSLLSHRLLACESPGIQCAGQWQQPAMRGKYPDDAISGWIRKVRNDPNKTPCCFEKNFVLEHIAVYNLSESLFFVDSCGFMWFLFGLADRDCLKQLEDCCHPFLFVSLTAIPWETFWDLTIGVWCSGTLYLWAASERVADCHRCLDRESSFCSIGSCWYEKKDTCFAKNVEIPTDFKPFEFLLNLKFLYKGVFPFAQENFFYVRQDLKFSNLDTWPAWIALMWFFSKTSGTRWWVKRHASTLVLYFLSVWKIEGGRRSCKSLIFVHLCFCILDALIQLVFFALLASWEG